MNNLYLHTRATDDPHVFYTFWSTGLMTKGKVVTRVSVSDDRGIAAELSAAQYLLEDRNVCGHNKAGSGLRVFVTFGNIRKLLRAGSDKSHLAPYASFLRTRFLGAEVVVENRKIDWVDAKCEERVDQIDVVAPKAPLIEVQGFGQVELTSHAVEQYVERFGCNPERAWHYLRAIAREVKPLTQVDRSAFHDIKHRQQGGKFVLHRDKSLIMVITPPEKLNSHPRIVTIYRAARKATV